MQVVEVVVSKGKKDEYGDEAQDGLKAKVVARKT